MTASRPARAASDLHAQLLAQIGERDTRTRQALAAGHDEGAGHRRPRQPHDKAPRFTAGPGEEKT